MRDTSASVRSAHQRSRDLGTAVIVGASLAGLMTALALSRAGMPVTMLERSADTGRTGAALHVEHGLLKRIMGTEAAAKLTPIAPGVQTWFTVHASLRAAAEGDPNIELHHHVSVLDVSQHDDVAWAITSDGRKFKADIVIGADGHRSHCTAACLARQAGCDFRGLCDLARRSAGSRHSVAVAVALRCRLSEQRRLHAAWLWVADLSRFLYVANRILYLEILGNIV